MKRKLAIIHFLPLEYYPPVTNFIDYVDSIDKFSTKVFTTNNRKNRPVYISKNSLIKRYSLPDESGNVVFKLITYLGITYKMLCQLIYFKPTYIFYYESVSALPTYLYCRFINRKCKILVHYHEYASKEWYRNGMKYVQLGHYLEERFIYKKASWISQTNEKRLELFHSDQERIKDEILKILPNFPPKCWSEVSKNPKTSNKIQLVYIGTLSLDGTYIKELCDWVIKHSDKVELEIYGYNLDDNTKVYLLSLNQNAIKIDLTGIDYFEIPNLLSEFHAGFIIYKALNENYRYNAPNKLMEYLACGLNVVYPNEMLGIKEGNFKSELPILGVDFNNLETLDFEILKRDNSDLNMDNIFCAENEYSKLIEFIKFLD